MPNLLHRYNTYEYGSVFNNDKSIGGELEEAGVVQSFEIGE